MLPKVKHVISIFINFLQKQKYNCLGSRRLCHCHYIINNNGIMTHVLNFIQQVIYKGSNSNHRIPCTRSWPSSRNNYQLQNQSNKPDNMHSPLKPLDCSNTYWYKTSISISFRFRLEKHFTATARAVVNSH